MKQRTLTEGIGWYGVGAIVIAYGLSNTHMIDIDSLSYKALNLTGAAALITDSWPDRNWQVIILNSIWACIALITVLS